MTQQEIQGILDRLHSTIDSCLKRSAAVAAILSVFECYVTAGTGCAAVISSNIGFAIDQAWACIKEEVSVGDMARFLYGAALSEFKASFNLFTDSVSGSWDGIC